jgi:hypothetical protein
MAKDLETRYDPEPPAKSEPGGVWQRMSPLEKVGVVAIGVVAVGVAGALLAPGLASTTVGGALLGAGGWLVGKGMRG